MVCFVNITQVPIFSPSGNDSSRFQIRIAFWTSKPYQNCFSRQETHRCLVKMVSCSLSLLVELFFHMIFVILPSIFIWFQVWNISFLCLIVTDYQLYNSFSYTPKNNKEILYKTVRLPCESSILSRNLISCTYPTWCNRRLCLEFFSLEYTRSLEVNPCNS